MSGLAGSVPKLCSSSSESASLSPSPVDPELLDPLLDDPVPIPVPIPIAAPVPVTATEVVLDPTDVVNDVEIEVVRVVNPLNVVVVVVSIPEELEDELDEVLPEEDVEDELEVEDEDDVRAFGSKIISSLQPLRLPKVETSRLNPATYANCPNSTEPLICFLSKPICCAPHRENLIPIRANRTEIH